MTVDADARALVAGEGRYARGTSFEPLLVPIVAGHVPVEEVWFTCYAGSLVARPNPRLGWPLLGIAVAHAVAPLVTADLAWEAVQSRPGEADQVLAHLAHTERARTMLYRSLVATYSRDSSTTAVSALELLDGDVPGWYWCTLAAHLDDVGRTAIDGLMANGRVPNPWADHYDHLLRERPAVNPLQLPAVAHPFGRELVALIALMAPGDRMSFTRHVLNGVVDKFAVEVTSDDLPVLFPGRVAGSRVAAAPRAHHRAEGSRPTTSTLDGVLLVPVPVAVPDALPVGLPTGLPVGPRVLRVEIEVRPPDDAEPVAVIHSFVRGADHRMVVSIGAAVDARPTTIAASVPLDDDIDPDAALTLTLRHDGDIPTRRVVVPSDRSAPTEPAQLSLFVRADERCVVATIDVVQHDRVVQQAVLIGNTGTTANGSSSEPIQLRVR